MIKITHIQPTGPAQLDLTFSDGSAAHWSAADLIARNTELTTPLADPAYFSRAFIEADALAWPNGLELSPAALYQRWAKQACCAKQRPERPCPSSSALTAAASIFCQRR